MSMFLDNHNSLKQLVNEEKSFPFREHCKIPREAFKTTANSGCDCSPRSPAVGKSAWSTSDAILSRADPRV